MKKFIVGLLGVFMMLGASILYACGSPKIELTLSTQSVSIQLNGNEDPISIVYADVTGIDDKSISLNFTIQDEIAKASVSQNSEGKNIVEITAINEGETELILSTKQGNIKKSINIEVYSEVTSMTEKNEDVENKSNKFVVKGKTNTLVADDLISFAPATSNRKEVDWTFATNQSKEYDGAVIEGQTISLPEEFNHSEIVLTATTHLGINTNITISCLDIIDTSILDIGGSKTLTGDFVYASQNGDVKVEITPNIAGDTNENLAYLSVKYLGDIDQRGLEISPIIKDSQGQESSLLYVVSEQIKNSSLGYSEYLFRVFAEENKNVNQTFYISFNVGYKDFNYQINTDDLGYGQLIVDAREKINSISVTKNNVDASLSIQTLYSQYSTTLNNGFGQVYKISLKPDTVIDVSGNYQISIFTQGLDIKSENVPPILAYVRSGGAYNQIAFNWDPNSASFVSEEISSSSSKILEHEIYLKANQEFFDAENENGNNITILNGLKLSFVSVDNKDIQTLLSVKLVKNNQDITFENAIDEILINSSVSQILTQEFVLHGQTTIDGLSVVSNSKYVEVSQPKFMSTDGENVRFSIEFVLKEEFIGITDDTTAFTIVHENGASSEDIPLKIYYPLSSVSFSANTTNVVLSNNSQSMIVNGEVMQSNVSPSVLMIKNGTSNPITHSYNQASSGNHAQAQVSLSFYDFVFDNESEIDEQTQLENFLNLYNENILQIIQNSTPSSNIVSSNLAVDNLRTISEGYTYVVLSYNGIGEDGQSTLIQRVVLIHSYNAIDSFSIYPTTDNNFSIYALNSVGQYDEITKTIKINFSSVDVKYNNTNNFVFKTDINGLKIGTISSDKIITWTDSEGNPYENKYFEIYNVNIQGTYIQFDVLVLSTQGSQTARQLLQVEYSISSEDTGLDILGVKGSTTPYQANIEFTIINADRVEKLSIDGIDENGLYFEIGQPDQSSKTIIVKTSPDNAKNSGVSYIIVDENGNQSNILNISAINSGRLLIELSKTITEAVNGTLYLFPSDAVYEERIYFEYYSDESLKIEDDILLTDLWKTKLGSQITNFQWLIENAFYTNNQGEEISFASFFKAVEITVADGLSFEHAYRVYNQDGFNRGSLSHSYFYTVMNNITIDNSNYLFETFNGGLQGYSEDVTITLNGGNFANELSKAGAQGGVIRNISFNGNVSASGFVVNVNSGVIKNVVIDTNGLYSSYLTSSGQYVGGIAGENTSSGSISDVSILGLTINAPKDASVVGGVVGKNSGSIEKAKIEFYRLFNTEGNKYLNQFTGKVVGGVIGEQATSGAIKQVYVYDYILSSSTSNQRLNGDTVGAIVGKTANNITLTIQESFALVDNRNNIDAFIGSKGENEDNFATITYSNSYISYYDNNSSLKSVYSTINNESLFISKGATGFNEAINGGNKYLIGFHQDEKVSQLSLPTQAIKDEFANLYKAIFTTDSEANAVVFFKTSLKDGNISLTQSQSQDLKELNTIKLSDFENINFNNVILTAENSNKEISNNLIVNGNEIYLQSLGQGVLKLYSKQDVKVSNEYNFIIENSLSSLVVKSQANSGTTEEYTSDSIKTINIQKTKSREFVVEYATDSVYLGNDSTEFELNMINTFVFSEKQKEDEEKTEISFDKISSNSFVATSDGETDLTVTIFTKITENSYQSGITNEIGVTFTLHPTTGAIAIGYDRDKIELSPSNVDYVTVSMQTTMVGDKTSPVIVIENEDNVATELKRNYNEATGVYTYSLNDKEILTVEKIAPASTNNSSSVINISETYRIEIASSHKSEIKANEEYKIYFVSDSGFVSEKIDVILSRQDVSTIDITNYKVKNSSTNNGRTEYETLNTTTGVMAPGTSSIMHLSINPNYAYYDFIEVNVEGNMVNAVRFLPVEKSNLSNIFYSSNEIIFNSSDTVNGFKFDPNASEANKENKYDLYFHVWFSNTIAQDCTLTFTITYYIFNEQGKAEAINYVNSYIYMSYLTEPTISIDGQNSTLLAKGGSAEVEITVDIDQEVESVTLSNATNIDIIKTGETTTSTKRIYTYKLSSTVLSKGGEDDNRFYINATVIRRINNAIERKTATATITLVDFKIDENNIYLEGEEDGVYEVWTNVDRLTSLNYVFDPETLNYDSSDQASIDSYNLIIEARKFFERNHYYPQIDAGNIEDGSTGDYLINVKKRQNADQTYSYSPISLEERIYYVINGVYVPISDGNENFNISVEENGDLTISAKTLTQASQTIMIETIIETNGEQRKIETFVELVTKPYSDEDIPLMVNNADEFTSLANSESNEMNDYILMNDIILENYTPFNTDFISSFDGNGHTIYIRSFNTNNISNSSLNLALFNNVNANTTLKNIRVNLYEGGSNIKVDISKVSTLKVAGLAISNNGIITNCEVVTYYSDQTAMNSQGLFTQAIAGKKSGPSGINIVYNRGEGTSNEYMQYASSWSSEVAGFVVENNGNITNSRVGGDEVLELSVADPTSILIEAKYTSLETFTIQAQGQVAGFVLQNSGSISASFVENLSMVNESKTSEDSKAYASGFVGNNSGKIITSYVEGVKQSSTSSEKVYARLGSKIQAQCIISGFVLSNTGENSLIEDCYSNILISSSDSVSEVYLASGFVYENNGKVKNCYSASQVENQKFSQMNFSGLDAEGNLLANGEYENCYYYNKDYDQYNDTSGSSTESSFDTNVIMITDAGNSEYFYGFAIASLGSVDGVWAMDTGDGVTGVEGLKLIEPDLISHSYRYVTYVGNTENQNQLSYQLPYGTIYFDENSEDVIKTDYGTNTNPIIIRNAEEFVEVMGASNSTPIQMQYNDNVIYGTYRIVDDIDMTAFSSQVITLPSTQKAFSGKLYGNGFTINGLSLSYGGSNFSYGLYKSIEPFTVRNGNGLVTAEYYPQIINLNIETGSNLLAADTVFVGTLAGYVKDALLINLDIQYNNFAMVQGRDFVGTLAGLIVGNSVIKNINVENPNVQATRLATTTSKTYFSQSDIISNRNNIYPILNYLYSFTGTNTDSLYTAVEKYSYAGGVAGYVDLYTNAEDYFKFTISPVFNVSNIRVSGIVNVTGQVVGGAFGLTAHQTYVQDVGITFTGSMNSNSSHILSTKDFAGGVIGQSFGYLSKLFATHEEDVQSNIEKDISSFYLGNNNAERGILDLFMPANSSSVSYSQQAIGGLVGQVGAGLIEISYSKINVISTTAKSAGGLIGEVDLSGARSYNIDLPIIADGNYTKFLLHETYATGDVRAYYTDDSGKTVAGYSGGLIGYIANATDRVALLSTNAINFFTDIDYRTGNKYQTNELYGSDNSDNTITQYYQFVGGSHSDANMSSVLKYLTARYVEIDSSSSVDEQHPTVGYVQNYVFNGDTSTKIKVNLFEGNEIFAETKMENNPLYQVEGIYTYVSGTAGYQATQKLFLNSGVWDTSNWTHSAERFFPEIRYSLADPSTIYLDNYEDSIVYALNKMQENPTITVIVRGLPNKNAEGTYKDVDLTTYDLSSYDLSSFAGTITSSTEYQTDNDEQVRLIIDQSLLKSTSVGASFTNLHIEYENSQSNNIITGGLLSSSDMEGVSIENLTLHITDGVNIQPNGENVGLIAPSIVSSQINGITIKAKAQGNYTYAMSVSLTDSQKEQKNLTINAGLIAGSAIQNSSTAGMYVQNIKFETSKNLLTFVNIEKTISANVGLMFGKVAKGEGAYQSSVYLGNISLNDDFNSDLIDLSGNKFETLQVGGYIGTIEQLNNLSYDAQNDGATISINLPETATTVYAGGVVGYIGEVSKISLNTSSGSSTVEKHYNITINGNNFPFEKSYIGGFVGYNECELTLSSMNFDFNLSSVTNNVTNSKETIPDMAVGGIIGYTTNKVTLKTIKVSGDNGVNEIKSYQKDQVAIGSVIGYASNEIDMDSVYSSLNISYSVTNDTTSRDSSDNGLYIGGLVGYYGENNSVNETMNNKANGVITDTAYIGTMTLDLNSSKNLQTSGIIGHMEWEQTISNSVFGGTIILKNVDGKDVTVGGTVGQLESSASIQNANNYGEVFVGYDSGTATLNSYTFGGIIGNINSADSGSLTVYLFNSNSAVTNHNARLANNNKANALVGAGEITGSGNYYNSAVCLALDTQGTDIGYSSSSVNGFGATKDSAGKTIINKITGSLDTNQRNFIGEYDAGHKLNPESKYESQSQTDYSLTYYTASKDLMDDMATAQLLNVAIVGNFETLSLSAPISSISGYTSISGVNFQINYNDDDGSYLGGLVNSMSGNSMIYGVGVNGSMSIGGTTNINIAGIAGQMTGGLIAESYTSLDMIYRADAGGTISAIANYTYDNDSNGEKYYSSFISYTYATGSVTTYIDANMYAFASSNSDNLKVSNCYTIAKLDWNDYTSDLTSPAEGIKIGTTNTSSTTNFYYDKNALNNSKMMSGNVTSDFITLSNNKYNVLNGDNWSRDINFNYGYPTRGFNYLKQSSWANKTDAGDSTYKEEKSSYDDYVKTFDYTRLTNGTTPSTTNVAYMISNVGIMQNVGKLANSGAQNFVLLYDIDLPNTQYKNNWNSISSFVGVFDGQDKTITGLNTTSLFGTINGGEIRNLRLTEANSSTALLADAISSGTVSNIILEGEVRASVTVGALVNIMSGGSIDTVTSMVKITGASSIGGIVGQINIVKQTNNSGSIHFCSSYGPLSSTGNGAAVGGIVGNITSGNVTVDYCFNGGSILSGYTNTSSVDNGFYAGGIVGNNKSSNITVSNCYNAAMVKAGNKYNGSMSYAAGIVGNSVSLSGNYKITNCYNEGPIEALGVDPTTDYAVTGVGYDTDTGRITSINGTPQIELRQTNNKNVSAYSISNTSVTNCNDNNCEIINNGAYLELGKSYASADYNVMNGLSVNSTTYPIMYNMGGDSVNYGSSVLFMTSTDEATYNRFQFSNNDDKSPIEVKFYSKNNPQRTPIQFGENGLPEIFVETQKVDAVINCQYFYRGTAIYGGAHDEKFYEEEISSEINRHYYYDMTDKIVEIDKFSNSNGIDVQKKENFKIERNIFATKEGDNQQVKIANNDYYLAEGASSVLGQSTYQYIWTYESDEIDSSLSWNFTDISVKVKDAENKEKWIDLQDINVDVQPKKFIFTYYGKDLNIDTSSGSLKFSAVSNKNETIVATQSDFIYLDEEKFAINIGVDNKNSIYKLLNQSDYSIQKNDEIYSDVVAIKDSGNVKEYYFVLKGNQLIYYFDVNLYDGEENKGIINEKGDKTTAEIVSSFPTEFNFTLKSSTVLDSIQLNIHNPDYYSANISQEETTSYNKQNLFDNNIFSQYFSYVSGGTDVELKDGEFTWEILGNSPDNYLGYMSFKLPENMERLLLYGDDLGNAEDPEGKGILAYSKYGDIHAEYRSDAISKFNCEFDAMEIDGIVIITIDSSGENSKGNIQLGIDAILFSTVYLQTSNEEITNVNENTIDINYDIIKTYEREAKIGDLNITKVLTYKDNSLGAEAIFDGEQGYIIEKREGESLLQTNIDLFIKNIPQINLTYQFSYLILNNVSQTNVVYSLGNDVYEILRTGESKTISNIEVIYVPAIIYGNIRDGGTTAITYFVNSTPNEVYEIKGKYNENTKSFSVESWIKVIDGNESASENMMNTLTFDDYFQICEFGDNAIYFICKKTNVLYTYHDAVYMPTAPNKEKTVTCQFTKDNTSQSFDSYSNIEYNNDGLISAGKTFTNYFGNNFSIKLQNSLNKEITNCQIKEATDEPIPIILINDVWIINPIHINFNVKGCGKAIILAAKENSDLSIITVENSVSEQNNFIQDIYLVGVNCPFVSASEQDSVINIKTFGFINNNNHGLNCSNLIIYNSINGSEEDIELTGGSIFKGVVVAHNGTEGNKNGYNISLDVGSSSDFIIKAGDGINGECFTFDKDNLLCAIAGKKGTITITQKQEKGVTVENNDGKTGGIFVLDITNDDQTLYSATIGKVYVTTDSSTFGSGNHLKIDDKGKVVSKKTNEDWNIANAIVVIQSAEVDNGYKYVSFAEKYDKACPDYITRKFKDNFENSDTRKEAFKTLVSNVFSTDDIIAAGWSLNEDGEYVWE